MAIVSVQNRIPRRLEPRVRTSIPSSRTPDFGEGAKLPAMQILHQMEGNLFNRRRNLRSWDKATAKKENRWFFWIPHACQDKLWPTAQNKKFVRLPPDSTVPHRVSSSKRCRLGCMVITRTHGHLHRYRNHFLSYQTCWDSNLGPLVVTYVKYALCSHRCEIQFYLLFHHLRRPDLSP